MLYRIKAGQWQVKDSRYGIISIQTASEIGHLEVGLSPGTEVGLIGVVRHGYTQS